MVSLPSKTPPILRRTSTLRALFFVTANLVGFVAANAFLYYLAAGRWMDLSPHSYRRAVAAPLDEMFRRPLSVLDHPWMMIVGGLLVSAVVFVPVMVAVLYRLRVSGLFVLAVAVVGHAPLLAVFLAAGCVLAAQTSLRGRMPFLALLAGLSPVVVYLYFFSTGAGASMAELPLQRLPIYLSFVLAMATAVLAGAAVLLLARLTRFRPGVIWPVLLLLLAVPVLLFYQKVGSAEMDYALIAERIGPGDAVLTPPDAGGQPATAKTRAAANTLPAQFTPAGMDLERKRTALLAKCAAFIRRHPDSARAPAVMWIMTTAKDIRIDTRAMKEGSVRYIYAGPSMESKSGWSDLAERYPHSPQAMVAQQRLGIQAMREGRARKAWEHLRTAQSLLMTYLGRRDEEALAGQPSVFVTSESVPGAEYYRKILSDTGWIIWMTQANKVLDGTDKNAEAFRDYMRLWPFVNAKAAELRDLAKGYHDTNLADNFTLQSALAEKDGLTRASKLSQLAMDVGDSAVTANYELGRLALKLDGTPAWSAAGLKNAGYYFKIVRSAQENPYHAAAGQHLAWLAGRKGARR